ncbi:tyrosine-protein kinase Shark [Episyrphus balteatus]|uniref:tyrosine-protein kinase Shark n=1 Tax=Episyrphus balteatus TaxID=286459 RepID=UPI002485D6EF|nr:tyrosine-protein kinase Shark [Episyrphus balteatus]
MSSRDENLFWFHGKITRERAEEILKEENREDGSFLVRESNTALGDFVLSVLFNNDVCHYQIRRHGEDAFFSIDDKIKIMHGLDSLVDYYREAANGLVTKLTQLVKKDLPPNDSRSHGTTNLLHRATKETNQTVVSELLKCGYRNVDAKNQDGQTAVHLAALHSSEEILKLLLNANVNVNCMDSNGNTPLHYACRTKSASFVRTLIAAKANIQVRNITTGYVPLHDAAANGNLEAVKELIAAHAPHLPRTESGEFPIDLAKEMNRTEVVEFLSNYKPPAASTFKHQWYHGTLERQEAIKVLMDYAANFDSPNDNDKKYPDEPSSSAGGNELNAGVSSEVLPAKDKSGIFLIRSSTRHGYVLTMLCQNNTPKNFLIKQSQNFLYIDEGPYLPSLEHLVEHFSLFSDGLPINLKQPVPPKPKPPLPLFSTMPKAMSKKNIMQQQLSLCTPNVSHPGDDAMNRVGLFENDDCIMLGASPKKPKEKRDMLIFRSLKPAKRNVIIDGMKSLRKVKIRSPSKVDQEKLDMEAKKKNNVADDLQKAGAIINNLSFSTDFLHPPNAAPAAPATPNDSLYNVPQNNSVVPNIEPNGHQDVHETPLANVDSKTEEEVEYFTKNDVLIDRERGEEESDYFVDAPPPINMKTFPLNSDGYIPTEDIRKFIDMPSSEETTKLLEESAAELREFSKHPERLDSVMSTASNDSEFHNFLNRQISSVSALSENSRAKLNYFIPKDCLELEHIIGEGEFGSVYKGFLIRKDPNSKTDVRCPIAIKTLRDEHCRSNKQEFLREASVMIRLKHHCIVQLIGISKGKSLMMVQEMVPLGSMLHFIIENSTKINPNCELKIWASQIACGMNYLESQHFVHRDLAARNILLASRNQAKISDFGLSRAMGTDKDCYQATQGGKWPIKWYAPESYNNGYFSHASDVWSFGVTLWEMFSLGEPPYGDIRGVDAIELIESGQRLQKPLKCPDNVYKIMENCWNYKPKDRPTFRYLTDFFANDPDYQNLVELIKSTHIS